MDVDMKNGNHSNRINIATNAPEYFNNDDNYNFVALGTDSGHMLLY